MTILFPSLGSDQLRPYEAPLGRMMLAYGRAIAATIALVAIRTETEAKAVEFVAYAGTKELPKRIRQLFRGALDREQFDKLNASMTKLKSLADQRHHIIHGEWWFNVFENGQLEIRAVRQGKIKHMSTVSAHDLGQWALELNDIADVLDDIECRLKQQAGDDLPFAE
jgi:hypothetical protein